MGTAFDHDENRPCGDRKGERLVQKLLPGILIASLAVVSTVAGKAALRC